MSGMKPTNAPPIMSSFLASLDHPAALAVAAAGYTVRGVAPFADGWKVYIVWPVHRGQLATTPGKRAKQIVGFEGQFGWDAVGEYLVIRSAP